MQLIDVVFLNSTVSYLILPSLLSHEIVFGFALVAWICNICTSLPLALSMYVSSSILFIFLVFITSGGNWYTNTRVQRLWIETSHYFVLDHILDLWIISYFVTLYGFRFQNLNLWCGDCHCCSSRLVAAVVYPRRLPDNVIQKTCSVTFRFNNFERIEITNVYNRTTYDNVFLNPLFNTNGLHKMS